MSISWLATALVLACAFPLMVSARAANVTVVNGTTLYAETKYNLYELSEGRLTIYFRSPNGEFRATNRALLSWKGLKDSIFWTYSRNGTDLRNVPENSTFGCNSTFVESAFYNYSVWYQDKPDGSVHLFLAGNSKHSCRGQQTFILVDKPTEFITDKLNFTTLPSEVKIEVEGHCDWRQQVQTENPTLDPGQTLYLRARLVNPSFTVSFIFEDPIDATATQFIRANQSHLLPAWETHVPESCLANTTGYYLPRPLPYAFNFSSLAGVFVPTESIRASFFFLAWGVSDNAKYSFVDANVDYAAGRFNPNNVTVSVALTMEFEKYLFYDPTMEFLFIQPPPTPGAASPTAALELQTVSVAMPVAVSVVVVVVAAAVVIGIIYGVKKSKRDQKRLNALKETHPPKPDRPTSTSPSATSTEPTRPTAGSMWKSSSPQRDSLKNSTS